MKLLRWQYLGENNSARSRDPNTHTNMSKHVHWFCTDFRNYSYGTLSVFLPTLVHTFIFTSMVNRIQAGNACLCT
jgi:hypothetical protein